ncbi:hypothetical protein DBR47_22805 [Paucibacter sp. KBW04]|uniref:sensor histidine kinase n=1 Tax=Paucibacter sp. KBW04 TaxID=2153361 RepID=UPI000F56E2E4|nr:ATP-binding protein [Paucibacter sp. KBW04]RQO54322.1 hypothetical protein DBR47_22805 [Paucibacter sp. KBW04]
MTKTSESPSPLPASFDEALLGLRLRANRSGYAQALRELDAFKQSRASTALEIHRTRILELHLLVITGQLPAVEVLGESTALLAAALATYESNWQGEAYLLQATIQRRCGMRAAALASAVAAVDLFERLGNEDMLGEAVIAQALAVDFLVDGTKAFVSKWLQRQPPLSSKVRIHLHNVMGTAEFNLAEQSGDLQAYRRAIDEHERVVAMAGELGKPLSQALAHVNVSVNAGLLGDLHLAEVHLQAMDRLYDPVRNKPSESQLCWVAFCRGLVAFGRGEQEAGFALLLKAKEQAQATRRACLAPLIKIQELLLKHSAAYEQGRYVADWVSELTRLHKEFAANSQELTATSFEELVKSAQATGENRVLRSHGDALTRELAASNQSLKDTVLELRSEVGRRERAEAELQKINEELELRVQQRTAELQTAQASIAAHERMAALSRLVSGLAHRLNTPLGNARMVVSGLGSACEQFEADLAKGVNERELHEFIDLTRQTGDLAEAALKQASELMRVFKQVSTLEHVEEAKCFDPGEALQECCDSMQEELKLQTVVPLHLELRDRPQCFGYLQVLAQVLKHLLANAMLHGQPELGGAGQAGVWITQEQQGDRLQISVRDEGLGIPPDRLASIFEPFNNKLNASGLGLGLHIARNLVTDLLQGQLTVTSQPGQGTCFVLSLPLRVNEATLEYPALATVS